MLARGELQFIGATTNQEFRAYIQKDAALERRFGRVQLEEPSPDSAEAILEGLASRYERYHGVKLPPDALHAAVELSVRYLPGRCLPDKAIDLVDEACAAARIQAEQEGDAAPVLGVEQIARVVAQASGVPACRVGEQERERLARLEQRLNDQVVGQPQATAAVAGSHPPQPHRAGGTGSSHGRNAVSGADWCGENGAGKSAGCELVWQ